MQWEFHLVPIWLQQWLQAGEFEELLKTQWEKAGKDSNAGWKQNINFSWNQKSP